MKVAYVALLPTRSIGIERHIEARAAAAHVEGIDDIDFYIIGEQGLGKNDTKNSKHLIRIPYDSTKHSIQYINNLFFRFRELSKIKDFSNYDKIVLRYTGADPSYNEFVKNYSVITEHHTNILSEMRAKTKADFSWVEKQIKKIRFFMEQRYGPNLISKCSGLIGVTNEIRKMELDRSKADIPSTAISNGINVESITPTGFKHFDGNSLNLAFVAAHISQSRTPWHGVDRLVRGITRYKGNVSINLHLIGQCELKTPKNIGKHRIFSHGVKSHQEYDTLMSQMNLGVSALAQHRIGLTQACSLKTREYLARGLPFLLGYDDPDFDVQNNSWLFQAPPNDEPIEFDKLVEHCNLLRSQSEKSIVESMRNHAKKNVDWRVKINEMWAFLESL